MIEELLEVLLEGTQGQGQPSRQQQAPPNPWMDLMEDILGGPQQGTSRSSTPQPGATSLGIDDILGMVLGGDRQGAVGGNPLLAPFTNMLSERLGISPQMASVIVSAAFGLIMGQLQGGNGQGAVGADPRALANGLDLDDLLDGDFLKKNGVTEKVAKQTGMDAQEAEESLLKALELLGLEKGKKVQPASKRKSTSKKTTTKKAATKKSTAKAKTVAKKSSSRKKSGNLQHLLEDWEVHG